MIEILGPELTASPVRVISTSDESGSLEKTVATQFNDPASAGKYVKGIAILLPGRIVCGRSRV